MKPSYDAMAGALIKKNIRVSSRRKKILEYLCLNPDHPTVEQIYSSLKKEMPHLSRTTVYNTLRVLLEAGLVRLLTIEDTETRYDVMTEDHGHFKCDACGTIFNFGINPGALVPEDLSGFEITDKNVYFKGICPKCLSNIEDDDT